MHGGGGPCTVASRHQGRKVRFCVVEMKIFKTLLPLLLCAGASSAQAATLVVNQTLNLNRPVLTAGAYDRFTAPFNYNDVFTLNAGDTLVATVSFLGLDPRPQELTLNDVTALFPSFYQWSHDSPGGWSAQSSDVTATGKLELLDADGNVIFTSAELTTTEGLFHYNGALSSQHAGQYFDASALAGLPSSITFAAYRYTGTIDAYETPRPYPISYVTQPELYVLADSYSTNIDAVPEPACWAMMILGFGLVGVLARSQRRPLTA